MTGQSITPKEAPWQQDDLITSLSVAEVRAALSPAGSLLSMTLGFC